MRGIFRSAAAALFLCAVLASRAHAYIDPTAGGLMLQTVIAGAFGAAFWFRDAIASAFRRLTGRRSKK